MAKKTADPAVPPVREGKISQYVGAVPPPTVAPVKSGRLVPRGGGNKAVQEQTKGTRANILEPLGSQLRIVPNFHAQPSIEAQATQANGRIVPPKIMRSRASFDDGRAWTAQ